MEHDSGAWVSSPSLVFRGKVKPGADTSAWSDEALSSRLWPRHLSHPNGPETTDEAGRRTTDTEELLLC